MALAIDLKAGFKFYVGDVRFSVRELKAGERAVLSGPSADFLVTAHEATEVLPGVFVSVGVPQGTTVLRPEWVKLLIEAPREVKILRGNLYEQIRHPRGDRHPGGSRGPAQA